MTARDTPAHAVADGADPAVTAVTAVTCETGALVLDGYCAQPGDNSVEHQGRSVGTAERAGDELWLPVATISTIPSSSAAHQPSSTSRRSSDQPADLHKRGLSTESTALMTTSMRYGTDMTQDVRRPSARDQVALRVLSDNQIEITGGTA